MSKYRKKMAVACLASFVLCGLVGGVWYESVLKAQNRVASILFMVLGCIAIVVTGFAAGNLAAVWVEPCPDLDQLFQEQVMTQKTVSTPVLQSASSRHIVRITDDEEYMERATSLVEVA